ncbi:MAG: TatD family hydrolase [Candidatus Yanofskybacteria bacterium]|nr:TatD family hydrolase [Candidatus Yanofskybacteria bacterium]
MKIFDSHCHPQSPQYKNDREEVMRRALDAGVFMICVGTDLKMSKEAIALANKFNGVWASVGLHPNDNLDERYNQNDYKRLLAEPKVVAIGEVGLDYYRTTDPGKKKFQRERFEKQIELARESEKPLIIHCRDAHDDMISILKNWPALGKPKARPGKLEIGDFPGGVIHSFTGTYDDAKKYLELGFFLGFNGIVTFTHAYDEVVKNIPLKQMLLETDAPYLAPEPYRGKRNEPVNVKEVAAHIAKLRGGVVSEVESQTAQNTIALFKLQL